MTVTGPVMTVPGATQVMPGPIVSDPETVPVIVVVHALKVITDTVPLLKLAT